MGSLFMVLGARRIFFKIFWKPTPFLEIFESGYAPHVGDAERLAGKKVRRLYVTLPHNYHD